MKVSVCVIARNAEKTLEQCLNSIFSQSIKPNEIIVVNDASIDSTKQIAEKFDVQLIDLKKNVGTGKARSIAAISASNEIIAFTDSDCIVDIGWLKNLIEPFKHEQVGIVHGTTFTDKDDSLFFHYNKAMSEGIMQTSNAAFRKSCLQKINFFDENFSLIREDTDAMLRIQSLGFETVFDEKAKVFHPAKQREFSHIVKHQKRYENDALYYKKHPEFFQKQELSQKFSPNSQIFRAWISMLAVALVFGLLFLNKMFSFYAFSAFYFASMLFGVKLAGKETNNTSSKNLLFLIFFNPLIFLSSAFYLFKGMIKYRKLII
ncbi:MAG: glycosyltransferase family 2 protein [archaeon]|nr:glycosyltransferase family 2 protein [archaeon]